MINIPFPPFFNKSGAAPRSRKARPALSAGQATAPSCFLHQ